LADVVIFVKFEIDFQPAVLVLAHADAVDFIACEYLDVGGHDCLPGGAQFNGGQGYSCQFRVLYIDEDLDIGFVCDDVDDAVGIAGLYVFVDHEQVAFSHLDVFAFQVGHFGDYFQGGTAVVLVLYSHVEFACFKEVLEPESVDGHHGSAIGGILHILIVFGGCEQLAEFKGS
jgi:hypothetical protein